MIREQTEAELYSNVFPWLPESANTVTGLVSSSVIFRQPITTKPTQSSEEGNTIISCANLAILKIMPFFSVSGMGCVMRIYGWKQTPNKYLWVPSLILQSTATATTVSTTDLSSFYHTATNVISQGFGTSYIGSTTHPGFLLLKTNGADLLEIQARKSAAGAYDYKTLVRGV